MRGGPTGTRTGLPSRRCRSRPKRAHRAAGVGLVDVGDAQRARHVLEGAVALVAIQRVFAVFAAVGDVKVGVAVSVKVADGHARAHVGDARQYVSEFGVQARRLMGKVNA
jgi:hypothetical protein